MKMKTKIKLINTLLLLFCSASFAQTEQANYKREVLGIKDQWHKIILPNNIYAKVLPQLSDIRIVGITKENDTLEAPYILQTVEEKLSKKEVAFHLINQSKNEKGYYFTFEIPTKNPVNEIKLDFNQQNFDWKVMLQGSQNQQEWFTILEDYRILSIKNEHANYQFTKINFPDSKYRYVKLLIISATKPELLSAKISLNENMNATYRKYDIRSVIIKEEKPANQTIIHVDLKLHVPVCNLKLYVNNKIDYYRPITIEYLSDSTKTPKGWKYNYSILTSGTLNSIEKNEFMFNSTLLQKLKITIFNQDNEPLKIDSLQVKGYVHELIVRFNKPATYYLIYGNKQLSKPNYDIDRFTENIPVALTEVNLGNEQLIKKEDAKITEPLFKNTLWLWVVMGVIIIILGWFSVKMISQK
jgi:Protein of unknown function (DUF3999)